MVIFMNDQDWIKLRKHVKQDARQMRGSHDHLKRVPFLYAALVVLFLLFISAYAWEAFFAPWIYRTIQERVRDEVSAQNIPGIYYPLDRPHGRPGDFVL